jgi:hypothetical protein
MADAESTVDSDPAGAFDSLDRSVAIAWKEVNDRVSVQPTLLFDMDDTSTALGRFMAAAKRLPSVTKNIPEANRLALEGDQAGDDQQKQTFRAALQQSLFDCAANLYTANDCVLALAKEWKGVPDLANPATMPSTIGPAESRRDDRETTKSPTIPDYAPRSGGSIFDRDISDDASTQPVPATPAVTGAGSPHIVDLLQLVDTHEDAIFGNWSKVERALVSTDGQLTRIEFPYTPPSEYDFHVAFSRMGGHEVVTLICYWKGQQFVWIMSAGDDEPTGFDVVNGRNFWKSEDTVWEEHGQKPWQQYSCVVKVRSDRLSAFVDGHLISELDARNLKLTLWKDYRLKHNDTLGLVTNGATKFVTAEVVEQPGVSKPDQSSKESP